MLRVLAMTVGAVLSVGLFAAPTPAHALTLRNTSNNLGLVGYWPFNEGTSTLAGDFSGNGNTGTLTGGPTWTTGKKSLAVSFDGTNDYVSIPDNNSLDFGSASDFSLSAWVKFSASQSDYAGIAVHGDFPGGPDAWKGYQLVLVGNKIAAEIKDGTTQAGVSDGLQGTTSLNNNRWHLLTMSVTRSSANAKLYVDGVQEASVTKSNLGNDIASVNSFYVGTERTLAVFFHGLIDDVRIYNRALSATEILNMYNGGIARVTGANDRGLVGYWSMDDATGTAATDFSGSGNTGTLTNMSATPSVNWVNGYRGRALNFDGSNDYVNIPSTTNLPTGQGARTISLWLNQRTRATGATIGPFFSMLNGGSGQAFGLQLTSIAATNCINAGSSPNVFLFTDGVNSNNNICVTGSQIPSLNAWHHIVFIFNGSTDFAYYLDGTSALTGTFGTTINTNTTGINIGVNSASSYYFDGLLDDVRIYNRALSAQEVQDLYNATKVGAVRVTTVSDTGLVGYWNMDDGTSTTAGDFSGRGNTGTLTGFALTGATSNWVTGKRGKALDFDGSNDYVTVGNGSSLDITNAITISAWVKLDSKASGSHRFVVKNNAYYFDWDEDDGYFYFRFYDSGSSLITTRYASSNFSTGTWYYLAGTYDRTTARYYVNGAQVHTQASTNAIASNSNNVNFGANAGSQPFPGTLDDVRIYNRALSAAEVQTLYNVGR